jgi:hypothetical protein
VICPFQTTHHPSDEIGVLGSGEFGGVTSSLQTDQHLRKRPLSEQLAVELLYRDRRVHHTLD